MKTTKVKSIQAILFLISLMSSQIVYSAVYFSQWGESNTGTYGTDPKEVVTPVCNRIHSDPVEVVSNTTLYDGGRYYDENGYLLGILFDCIHAESGTNLGVYGAWRRVMSCPLATSNNLEYDIEGCGCSNSEHISLFEQSGGETGGEQGCKVPPPQPNDPPKTCLKKNTKGNPCQVSTGAKIQTETDLSNGLVFTRSYQTLNLVDTGLGKGWRSNFGQQLSISGDELFVIESSGRGDPWRKVNDVWESDVDSDYILVETATGFTVTGKRGDVMEYDLEGRLLSETDSQGKTTTYAYDTENRLITVSNHYQQSLSFTYSDDGKNHIIKVADAQGVEYRYEYDTNDNIVSVIYPDTNSDPLDNPKRIYHYENPDFPNHLTGITDANGNRYGTYAYDADGKAISTEHTQTTNSVGQERFQLNYQGAN